MVQETKCESAVFPLNTKFMSNQQDEQDKYKVLNPSRDVLGDCILLVLGIVTIVL